MRRELRQAMRFHAQKNYVNRTHFFEGGGNLGPRDEIPLVALDLYAVLSHGAKMRPACEQRYIEAGLRHPRTDVASDGPRSRNQKFHRCLSVLVAAYERGGESATANFPAPRRRNTFHQVNLPRTFVLRQKFAAMADQLRLSGAVRLVQNHRSGNFFSERGMGKAEGYSACHCGMAKQNLIHFVRRNVFASADDDVFDAAGQMQIAVRIEKSLIAGEEPSIHKRAGVGFGIIFVSTKYVSALNRDLAPLTGSQVIAIVIHDADLHSSSDPDGTCLPTPRG